MQELELPGRISPNAKSISPNDGTSYAQFQRELTSCTWHGTGCADMSRCCASSGAAKGRVEGVGKHVPNIKVAATL